MLLYYAVFKGYDDEDEEDEKEMVIGAPTDVEHLTHIGIGQLNYVSINNISLR